MRTRRHEVDQVARQLGTNEAQARFGVAALLMTYRCTIACRHCCFASSACRPDVVMSVEQALAGLAMLHDLRRAIHISGGEIMMYWPRLREIILASEREDLQPHFVQTNGSFAVNDEIVRERLGFLREHGVLGLYFSADPLHQEWVPPENVLRLRRIACETFGPLSVFGPTLPDSEILDLPNILSDEQLLAAYVRTMPLMLIGSSYQNLRQHYPDKPVESLNDDPYALGGVVPSTHCRRQFDLATTWEVHIDPYDNIQTNCGVILGNVRHTTPRAVLNPASEHADEMVRLLIERGPMGLVELAASRHGYLRPTAAKSKCALCYEVRRFLRQHYPQTFGPAEVYM